MDGNSLRAVRPTGRARAALAMLLALALLACAQEAMASPSEDEDIEEALQELAHEPPVAQVREMALRYQGLAEPNLDLWTRRARWSHAVPRLDAGVAWWDQRDWNSQFRERLNTDEEGALQLRDVQSDMADVLRLRAVYTLRAGWDLRGLVFDRSEPAIAQLVRQRQERRHDLLEEATELYFDRRHLQVLQRVDPEVEREVRVRRAIEIQSLTARLDALTGGWFATELARRRPTRRPTQRSNPLTPDISTTPTPRP